MKKLTIEDIIAINRLLGLIEGAAVAAPNNVATAIYDAASSIDEVLKKAGSE